MPQTHGLGPFYWHTQRYPRIVAAPLLAELGETVEYEEPYRRGRCVMVRPPLLRWGVALGWWVGSVTEENAQASALRSRETSDSVDTLRSWVPDNDEAVDYDGWEVVSRVSAPQVPVQRGAAD